MSIHLDKRQRAMLREMGVRVWLPATRPTEPPAEPATAIDSGAVGAHSARPASHFNNKISDIGTPLPRVASPPRMAAAAPAEAPSGKSSATWRLGAARPLYADTAQAAGARWLVLAETPAAALNDDPFHGDAGKLLGNMLRAARLHQAGAVLFAPLARMAAAGPAPDLFAALSELLANARPDLVLVMGRLAALALLGSAEPFGKLRGQVHRLQGANTIVTYDASYLLRNPGDKARAWEDLCLAMSLAPGGLARPG